MGLRRVAGYKVDQLYKAVTVLTLTHSCVLALLLNSGPFKLIYCSLLYWNEFVSEYIWLPLETGKSYTSLSVFAKEA